MIIITIEQIQYFLAIKDYGGFSAAAHELCISQSSLSKHIKALESELDTLLFERTSRITKLTPAGEDFYIYAQNFLNEYNSLLKSMKKHSISNKNMLNIGTIAVITQYKLTSALASFKNKYPQIDINIFEAENEEILCLLGKSEIDIAIVRDFSLSGNKFDVTTLAEDELVIVTSASHHFNQKESISFDCLKDENLIICSKSGIYDICMLKCNQLGFSPKVTYQISKIETILGLVSENLGITLIPSNVLTPFKDLDICIHPLKEKIHSNLVMATNKNTIKHQEINSFKTIIKENTSK